MEVQLSTGKAVKIREFKTRKIARGYEDRLFKDVLVTPGQDIKFPPANVNDANDYLVAEMAGLAPEEVQELDEKDFKKVLDAVQALSKEDDVPFRTETAAA